MKAFKISEGQIARVAGAAAADELSRRFNRHIDFLTISSWTAQTPLGPGGINLDDTELTACAARAAQTFGVLPETILSHRAEFISDWASRLADAVEKELKFFSFKPAARNKDTESCRHPADHIFQDAAAAANVFYGGRRILSFVAPHNIFGFILTVLTPALQGVECIDARGLAPEELSKLLSFGDVLVATPTLWRYMIREKLTAPDNTMAVSFGEPMSAELASSMRKAGFGVMREIYGATETGLIAWRSSPADAFVLFDHWARDLARLTRSAPGGEVVQTEAMDHIEWRSDRTFDLKGRRDGAIQIGAVNVFPKEVEKTLNQHKFIKTCRIEADERSDGVTRLVAHIVLKRSILPDEATAREIDAWCRANLRQEERPRIYKFEEPRKAVS